MLAPRTVGQPRLRKSRRELAWGGALQFREARRLAIGGSLALAIVLMGFAPEMQM